MVRTIPGAGVPSFLGAPKILQITGAGVLRNLQLLTVEVLSIVFNFCWLYLYSCTNNSVVICTAGIIGLVWLLAYLKPKKISESAGSGEGSPSPGLTLGVRMVLALI